MVALSLRSISLSPGDVRWVGAWWIGFIIPVVGLVLIAIPIFQYPAAFPKKILDGKKTSSMTITVNISWIIGFINILYICIIGA